ncbi:hypothetical protein SAMN05660297_03008 [Natronincola peptidivorans]|uniref:Uncharacterized protein n=1 Tax=Natronincola peptidivorans TaxID=426128 RepID=A0A1I0FZZ3_9FIRM|nr:hypothetical protein [Natronincola peptidivorans]SET64016.1 hypothetical protein SAMN05660297_03008 [Natronincola peptidivorans]
MAFNVCDKNGKHLGIIINNAHDVKNAALVALTHLTVEDVEIDFQGIKNMIANIYNCKTMLGKINEDKLELELKQLWKEKYNDLGSYNETYLLKLLLFVDFRSFNGFIHLDEEAIQGYIFVGTNNVKFYNENCIQIEEAVDYIDMENHIFKDEKPIFAKIIDYPELSMDVMGAEGLLFGGGLADLGGRNHAHETKLKVMSGNVIKTYKFPMHLYVKKNMPIIMYAESQAIKAIFCDGIIYKA